MNELRYVTPSRPRRKKGKTCRSCGKPSLESRTGLCRTCWYESRAHKPKYQGFCIVCGQPCPLKTARGRWRSATSKTCSVKCKDAAWKAQTRGEKERACLVCQALFWSKFGNSSNKYCSRRCYNVVLARRAAASMVETPCLQCGTTVRRHKRWVLGRVFCGKPCQKQFMVAENSAMWRGGTSLKRGKGWGRIAEGIRKRDGYACRRCGKTQEEAGQKLSVDHIVPWRARETEAEANDPSNLVALCRVCHAKKAGLERKWLNGDGLALRTYRLSVGLNEYGSAIA